MQREGGISPVKLRAERLRAVRLEMEKPYSSSKIAAQKPRGKKKKKDSKEKTRQVGIFILILINPIIPNFMEESSSSSSNSSIERERECVFHFHLPGKEKGKESVSSLPDDHQQPKLGFRRWGEREREK